MLLPNVESFQKSLMRRQEETDSRVCLGLDPDPDVFPRHLSYSAGGILRFCKNMVDATDGHACVIKPNRGYWGGIGAERELAMIIEYIQNRGGIVILDGKYGDIGRSARMYAQEAFQRYNANAATVNAYMGCDTLEPWFKCGPEKAILVLCHTSNKGAGEFQERVIHEENTPAAGFKDQLKMFGLVARQVVRSHAKYDQDCGPDNIPACGLGLVMGATFPEQFLELQDKITATTMLLIPGIGKQKGDLVGTLKYARRHLFVINSSSGIIHASQGKDCYRKAEKSIVSLKIEIREHLAEAA